MKLSTNHLIFLLAFLFLSAGQVLAQRTIRGQVTSAEDKQPMVGATVLVEGTSTGTVTDVDGNYEVVAKTGDVLIFNYTGMREARATVGVENVIDIVLETSSLLIEEVVVTGYGSQSRSTFTGSAVTVAPEKIENAPRVSFQQSLQGNVPGLFLTQGSGQPGANQSIVLRGLGSISASSQPLYVIDGIPVVAGDISRLATTSNTLAGINPNDIESITVLKDASATSIYGSRGANGVIIITTKSGKDGKPRITVNAQKGITDITVNDRNRPLNNREYYELLREGLINRGTVRFQGQTITTPEQANAFIASQVDTTVNTNWFDELTRQGQYNQLGLTVSGGNSSNKYYLSGGYYDEDAVVIGSDFKRLSAKLGLDNKLNDWLTVKTDINANHQIINTQPDAGAFANPVRSLYRLAPWVTVFNPDGSYNTSFNSTFNPVALAETNIREGGITNLLGSIQARVQLPLKGLTFEPRASINRIIAEEFEYRNPLFGDGRNVNGQGYEYFTQNTNWNVTNLLKYSSFINDTHGIDITLGQEAQQITSKAVSTSSSNYTPGLTTLANAAQVQIASSTLTQSSISSYFLNTSYNYRGIVYLNATGRRDGSSRFGANNRYGNFWSVGASVNFDRLGFLSGNKLLTQLRLRSSYGVNGNQEIGNFESRGLYSTGARYDNQPGTVFSQLDNPDLTWEKNKPFNVGLDLGLFNRISATVDYYNRITSDLLLTVPISSINGVTTQFLNAGEMKNSGVELTLVTQNLVSKGRGLNWTTDFNVSFNRNEITSLPNGDFIEGSQRRAVGQDYYTWHIEGFAGVNPETGRAQWYTDDTETTTTETYNQARRFDQGRATPDFFGGLTNTLSWRGLTLSFQFNFVWGNMVYDSWASFTHSDGQRGLTDTGNMNRYLYNNRWRRPGDVTDVPAMFWLNNTNSNQRSTRFLYDGSYIRLRDLALTYNVPSAVVNRLGLSNLALSLRSNNLWTWVKDDRLWQDPQVDYSGFLDQEIPASRTIVFGLDVAF